MAVRLSKAVPVTGRAGPNGCEMSRIPHFLDNLLADDGEVVSLRRRPTFTPRKIKANIFPLICTDVKPDLSLLLE
jgi:hypothetical protein